MPNNHYIWMMRPKNEILGVREDSANAGAISLTHKRWQTYGFKTKLNNELVFHLLGICVSPISLNLQFPSHFREIQRYLSRGDVLLKERFESRKHFHRTRTEADNP